MVFLDHNRMKALKDLVLNNTTNGCIYSSIRNLVVYRIKNLICSVIYILRRQVMIHSKYFDLIDLLTMRLGEISSSADCLGAALFYEHDQDPIYKSAYAIQFMVDDLLNQVEILNNEIKKKQ